VAIRIAETGLSWYDSFKSNAKNWEPHQKNTSPEINIAPIGFGLGVKINDYIANDISVQYRNPQYTSRGGYDDEQKIRSYGFLYNFILHKRWYKLEPFVFLGAGYGRNNNGDLVMVPTNSEPTITLKGKDTNNFIWNFGIGNTFKINKKFNCKLFYRYINFGKLKTHGGNGYNDSTQKLRSQEFIFSLMYKL